MNNEQQPQQPAYPFVPKGGQCGSIPELHQQELNAYLGSDTALFNDRVADGVRGVPVSAAELPEHRLMVLLKAQGYSNREIAELTNYTPVRVSQVLRQPWARRRIVELITQHGTAGIVKLLEGELANNITTLVEVRDDPNSRGSERIAAANALLDRYLGKPVAKVETTHRDAPAASVEELKRQLEQLKAEEERLKSN